MSLVSKIICLSLEYTSTPSVCDVAMDEQTFENVKCVDKGVAITMQDYFTIEVGTSDGGPGRVSNLTINGLRKRLTHRSDRSKILSVIIKNGADQSSYVTFDEGQAIVQTGEVAILTGPVVFTPVDSVNDVVVNLSLLFLFHSIGIFSIESYFTSRQL